MDAQLHVKCSLGGGVVGTYTGNKDLENKRKKTMIVTNGGSWTRRVLLCIAMFSTLAFVSIGCVSGTPPGEEWNKTFGGTNYDVAKSVQQTSDGGYIIAGHTFSYGAGKSDIWVVKTDSNGNEQWNKTFGGKDYDMAHSVQQTSDGGYIIAGHTFSYGTFRLAYGRSDSWLIKTDSNGNEQWNKTFGGPNDEVAQSVQQTSDGGYIFAGMTESYGTSFPDFWLVKTDSNGNEQWNKTSGGAEGKASSVQQTVDGGYIIAGEARSEDTIWSFDFWLEKTDSNGNEQWSMTFGGGDIEEAISVQQTVDGGYIIAGVLWDGINSDRSDSWLVKTDSNGKEQWNRTFGGFGRDIATSIQQTSDGGYIITGFTNSYGAGESDTIKYGAGFSDFWLVKTDSNGKEQWNRTFGGIDDDVATSVQQTTDGGYIIAGYTRSYGAGGFDFWMVKVEVEPAEEEKGTPGFQAIFTIVELLAVVYIFKRET